MRFSASVNADGSLRVHQHQKWTETLSQRKGQRVEIELRSEAEIRSNRQNRYWRGVCVPFVQEQWRRAHGVQAPAWAVHDALVRHLCNVEAEPTPLGPGRPSTATLTVAQFSELIEAAKEYALHEFGAVLPDPEEWSG